MGIKLPRYVKCCYCIPLKIALLLIGYFSIFGSLVILGTMSYSIFKVSEFVKESNDKPNPAHPPDDVSKAALALYLTFGYYLLVFLYCIIISIILVIGTHKSKPSYLRFYFKATLLLFALSIVLVIVTFTFMGFLATIPVLKWSITLLSFMIVARSYYLLLEEKEKPAVYELQPYVPAQQAPLMA